MILRPKHTAKAVFLGQEVEYPELAKSTNLISIRLSCIYLLKVNKHNMCLLWGCIWLNLSPHNAL